MIDRYLKSTIKQYLGDHKAIVVMGPRQVGKTTLLKDMFRGNGVLWLNGDDIKTQKAMSEESATSLGDLVRGYHTVVIDEAQRIENIGIKLKILYDNFGDKVQIVATGSSSFDLANKINEPMTGRKWLYRMYPLSFSEMVAQHGWLNEMRNLERRMIYGYYPAVVANPDKAPDIITNLAGDNLYRDALQWKGLRNPAKLNDLLSALALRIGSQVSVNELSSLIGMDNKTVEKYLSLLEKCYIIFRLPSYARNLRNELKVSSKFFFYDMGIRNAILSDFRSLADRTDIGNMFENFIIAEMQKTTSFRKRRQYFWRTSQQQEVDYLTEYNTKIVAAEIKWNEKRNPKLPQKFVDAYKPAETYIVNRTNFSDFLLKYQTQIDGTTEDLS